MTQPFDNMDPKRQEKLLNSGFQEFADHGYKRSSLNRILQQAKVSKGVFYHYFENKEEFFHFLIERGILITVNEFSTIQLEEESDYIKRLQIGAISKLKVAKQYPRLFDCLTVYYKMITPEEYLELANRISGNMGSRLLSGNIDFSLFREDLPKELAMKMVNKYITGVATEISDNLQNWSLEQIIAYYNQELDDLRKVVYKKETRHE